MQVLDNYPEHLLPYNMLFLFIVIFEGVDKSEPESPDFVYVTMELWYPFIPDDNEKLNNILRFTAHRSKL